MLDKKSARVLGLFILGVFLILLLSIVSVSAAKQLTNLKAQEMGYSSAEEAYYGLGKAQLKDDGYDSFEGFDPTSSSTSGSTPSAIPSSSNSIIAKIQTWGKKAWVKITSLGGGSGATATNINGVKYNSIFGLTEKQALIFSHILLGILFLIIIFTIIDVLPFFPANSGLRFLVAIIVTILSMMLLPSADIEAMMGTYRALGVVLTSIVPFLVMMAFTIKWDEKQPQYKFVSTIVWIGFIVYLGVRWINMPDDAALKWAYPITLALAIIFAIFKGWFVRMAIRSGIKGDFAKFDKQTRAEMRGELASVQDKITKLTGKKGAEADLEELKEKEKALKQGIVGVA